VAERPGGRQEGRPPGEILFARYAYAPNELGYCGPADSAALFELAATGRAEADITAIAARFSGTWPYLKVLASMAGIADPLDERVVRAYWTGGPLLDVTGGGIFGARLLQRITAAGAGRYWAHLTPELLGEAAPTHAFHVFGVYPWSRMLRLHSPGGRTEHPASLAAHALHVLDNCRIRWAQVSTVLSPAAAIVVSRRLTWDGTRLALGPQGPETVRLCGADGRGFVPGLLPGDWLALHWDWACERLSSAQLGYLCRWTGWQLEVTNARLARAQQEEPGLHGPPA
jgi:hypothetical protein